MSNYPRGSEWRRWDLHLHTPETNKNDQFEGNTSEEKWNNYYQNILDYVGDSSDSYKTIVAIGITDYLSIDNYLKVMGNTINGHMGRIDKLLLQQRHTVTIERG